MAFPDRLPLLPLIEYGRTFCDGPGSSDGAPDDDVDVVALRSFSCSGRRDRCSQRWWMAYREAGSVGFWLAPHTCSRREYSSSRTYCAIRTSYGQRHPLVGCHSATSTVMHKSSVALSVRARSVSIFSTAAATRLRSSHRWSHSTASFAQHNCSCAVSRGQRALTPNKDMR